MHHIARNRFVAVAVLVLFAFFSMASLAPAQAQAKRAGLSVPVTGTAPGGGTFVGTMDIQRFAAQGNDIVAVGTLSGTVQNAAGAVLGNIARTVALPVDRALALASCDILHLELGPLDLDLLGLVVHLDRVVLDITAEAGAGNLLGNLLCSVANLLNGGGPLSSIVTLLNRILDALLGG
jgi:hypothetical protein